MPEQIVEYRRLLDRWTLVILITSGIWVAGLALWGVYLVRNFEGIATIDALDIAQEARRLYRGEGLTTGFLKPVAILKQGGNPTPPDLYNSPVYVYLLAFSFKIFGISEGSILGSSLFWAFLAGILLFFLVRARHGLFFASLAFLLYAGNLGVIEGAFSGLPLSFVSFLLLLLTAAVYYRKPHSLLWTALLGFLTGFLYLAEFDFLFLSLPVLVIVLDDTPAARWKHALVFLAAFLLCSSPWWIRNARVAGNPLYSLHWLDFRAYSAPFPGNRIARDFDPAALARALPFDLFREKLARFLRLGYRFWFSFSHFLLMPLFLISIFRPDDDRRRRAITVMVYTLFMGELALIAAGNGDFGRMLAFIPLIVIVGLETGAGLLRSLSLSRLAALLLTVAFCAVCVYPGVIASVFGLPQQKYLSAVLNKEEAAQIRTNPSLAKMQSLVKADEVVLSDVPWAVAWYANRSAVWIPWKIDQMNELKKIFKNLRFLYLTPVLFKYPEVENVQDWQSIYRSGMVPEWLQIDRGILLPGDEVIMGDIIFERLELE
ncbi:MAG: glycosyltransferase family 39 protein [Candidatus Aureabacteria bacterium]|nr:glycosyltransferase family 39 protein [Candidatus Auribacterota bacterium]